MSHAGYSSTSHADPGAPDRRADPVFRQRFAAAERVLRVNNPRESVQAACMFGLARLQALFPDAPRPALASVVEAVLRTRRRRPRFLIKLPSVLRPRAPFSAER